MPLKHLVYQSLFLLLGLNFGASAYANNNHEVLNHLSGYLLSGDTPIAYADVRLYQAGTRHRATGARPLDKTTTDINGYFYLTYHSPQHTGYRVHTESKHAAPDNSEGVLYLIAQGNNKKSGQSPIKLAAVLDNTNIPGEIFINERTTVAAAYAMAQYTDGRSIGGKNPGLKNAAGTAQNLADLSNGEVSTLLQTPPNGELTSTLRIFNSLANMLAACVQDTDNCAALFHAARPPRGPEPRNTFAAMTNVAHNPGANFQELFSVSMLSSQYQPALRPDLQPTVIKPNDVKPNSWVLALRYNADGRLSGPGNLAFDKDGNAWINNNFEFSTMPVPDPPLCGSTKVYKLTPIGDNAPGSPYGGVDGSGVNAGGLYGAGFGIAVAPDDSAWITNFGFKTPDCDENPELLAVSVSRFSSDGTRLSLPDGDPATNTPGGYGYDGSGNLLQPQGVISDQKGNIWVANCADQSVFGSSEKTISSITRYPQGDPGRVENYSFPVQEFAKPFDVAIDQHGHAWVTGNGTGNVLELDRDGRKVGDLISGTGIKRPMGIASDSEGNLWFSDAGLPSPPCPAILNEDDVIGSDGSKNTAAAVTLIRHKGERREVTTFGKTADIPRDGLRWPWGIAVDGNDNVFVANFAGKRVMQLCGVKEQNCPPGVHTGDPVSLDAGFTSDALKRVTAIQIDTSGNVWALNNFEEVGLLPAGQENPGGHEIVVFIGLAAPVNTPTLGPVRKP